MDIALIFNASKGQFFFLLKSAAHQIPIQFIGQKFLHLGFAIFLLHHHQRGILCQRFRKHRAALNSAANHLMRPPLMRRLVCRNVIRVIQIFRIILTHAGNKTDGLRIRNRIRKRLRKTGIAREFNNPELFMLIRAECFGVIGQRCFHRSKHTLKVIAMTRLIINFYRHIAGWAFPHVLFNFIAR